MHLNTKPYNLDFKEKKKLIIKKQNTLFKLHYKNNLNYRNIFKNYKKKIYKIENLPYLSINLFKLFEMKSIKNQNIFKIITSSGTTGLRSKIFLDKTTALNQQKVLNEIVKSFIGNERLPMLILDSKNILINKKLFSARGAAVLGFSIFGRNNFFIINDKNQIDYNGLNLFLKKYFNNKLLIFGFTSQVFEILSVLKKLKYPINKDSILLHGGGWKKLIIKSINNNQFKKIIKKKIGIKNIYNYYGLVEQSGSIFMECKYGYFHCSNYSEIIIRDKLFNKLENNKSGIVQLLSSLPTSYPGHNILTEDIGEIIGEDDCRCKRKGKYFLIHNRIKNSEIRGCSDAINS